MTALASATDLAPALPQDVYGNMTRAQIGARLGISQMHVSRLMTQSLGYLRECLLGPDGGGSDEFTRIGES